MLTRMVLLGVALLACLGSSREGRDSTQTRRPVNDPGMCRASCRRFFACKGLNDAANEESCTNACSEGQVPGDLALRIAQAEECSTVLALAEGGAGGGPVEVTPAPSPTGPAPNPSLTQPVGPAPVCPEPAAAGEPSLTKLLAGRVWCAPGSPDGARAAERVVFHTTGDAALVSVDQVSAMPRSQVTACWRLEGTTLSFSRDGAAFAPVPVKLTKTAGKSKLTVGDRSYDDCTELP